LSTSGRRTMRQSLRRRRPQRSSGSRPGRWNSPWDLSPRVAGRCRSPPPGWGTCWTPWSTLTGCWGWKTRRAGTRCSGNWCWPGSSSRPASSTACGSLRRPGVAAAASSSYATVKRRLPRYAQEAWRQRLSAACAAHAGLGPASLVLYDVPALYFEADRGDGFREPGFSKERRLEPQITIGLLTGQVGFPLMVSALKGTRPRRRRCCRSPGSSWPPAGFPTSPWSPTTGMVPRRTRRPSRQPACRSSSA
jgi:hypothetical protein